MNTVNVNRDEPYDTRTECDTENEFFMTPSIPHHTYREVRIVVCKIVKIVQPLKNVVLLSHPDGIPFLECVATNTDICLHFLGPWS